MPNIVGAGLPPLTTPPPPTYLLGPREWAVVEMMERRAAQADRLRKAAEDTGRGALAARMGDQAKVWRQAAQVVREMLSRVDIDLRDPTVAAILDGVVTR